jgi:predicted LPLAT superfamily acyltransferase
MSFRACAIVPSRNHHRAIGDVVARLRGAGLPVFVIDDGSDEPAQSALAALDAPASDVRVFRFAANQGKGGAVLKGFDLAAAAGFSHAVQVDADGQHDLAALPRFLAAALAEPETLILGTPVYDATVPKARAIGRWLTTIWVWIETLSRRIPDAMCGFRVYPLAAVMALMKTETLNRGMAFDIDILVRLAWRGVATRPIPVGVTYPPGNTSNFALLRDNWQISKIHARLAFGMVRRLPSLVRGPPRSAASATHWSQLAERGLFFGLRGLAAIYRLAGRRLCLAALAPIVGFFYLTSPVQRAASRDFLARCRAAQGDAAPPGHRAGLRHAFDFARKAIETFAAWLGDIDRKAMEIATPAVLAEALAEKRGLILVVSHLGNAELSRALLDEERRSRMTVLVHTRHAENYNRVLRRFRPAAAANLVQVTELGPETAIELERLVDAGHWIAIAGDRTPVGAAGRVSRAVFLGRAAPFPQGPYLLAHLLGCPVYLLFCLRENGRYRVYLEKFAAEISLPRRDREASLDALAARYAGRLEAYCLRAPFQWYNFYDFWAGGAEPVGDR